MSSSSAAPPAAVAAVTPVDAAVAATDEVKKLIILRTSDEQSFEVEQSVISLSETVKSIIDDNCADDEIPLPNVTGSILAKVIEYCKKHVGDGAEKDEEVKTWDKDFMNIEQGVLFDLIMAANYMNVKGLLDLTCQTVADMIKGKTPEEIRAHFHIVNDFTPEEEEEIRRENQWAFE